jgi:flagellar biosynthesis/type III secretory pathway protein FliH
VQAALEVECTVYNINEGQNQKVADACEALAGYAHFVALFRAARDNGLDKNKAIDLAMRQCESEGVLADYLSEQRAEVKDMFLTEYDEERQRRIDEREKQERYEEGLAEGHAEGRKEVLLDLVKEGALSLGVVAEKLGMTEDEVQALL